MVITPTTTKECGMCGEEKHLTMFYKDNNRKDGAGGICKNCKRVYDKIKRRVLKEYVNYYIQSHPCVDCGESRPTTLEFDHVRGKHKNISGIVGQASSWSTLQKEIDKCEVRCGSCHNHRHRKDMDRYSMAEWEKEVYNASQGE